MFDWRIILTAAVNDYKVEYLPKIYDSPYAKITGGKEFYGDEQFEGIGISVKNIPAGLISFYSYKGKNRNYITKVVSYIRPKYRGQGLSKILQEAFVSFLNGKYGVGNYTISTEAVSQRGQDVIDYRKSLLFNPEITQKQKPTD